MSDRGRRQTRVPIQLEVEYRTRGNFLVAYSTNLSKGGLFLQTDTPLPVGTTLKMRFCVPGVDDPIETEAVVAWIRPAASPEGHPSGMGVEFGTLDARYGQVIDRVVTSFRGIRLLVVGGSGTGRTLLARYLRSIISCEILELTAADTLGAAAQQADLVLIDLDSSGPEGYDAVRATKARTQTPVVALAQQDEQRKLAKEAGADDVLPGQPSFNDLQAAVIRALGRPVRVS
jgi:uncharacterized protein (TIGR02266 family)